MVNEDIVKTLSSENDEEKKGDEPTVVASEAHQPLSFGALLIVGVCMVWTNIINGFAVILSAVLLDLLADDLKLAENNFQWTFNSFLLPLVSLSQIAFCMS